MDVTADGSYLLATTKHYLLIIPTQVDGQAKSGFAQSITNKAAAPIKLQLDPSDMVRYNISSLHFTAAHFNTGEGQEEFISTSTGPHIITWNFTKIKQGKLLHYKVKRCDSEVVADQFLYNHDNKMVVTLPGQTESNRQTQQARRGGAMSVMLLFCCSRFPSLFACPLSVALHSRHADNVYLQKMQLKK